MRWFPVLVVLVSVLDAVIFGVPEGWNAAIAITTLALLGLGGGSLLSGLSGAFQNEGGVQLKNTPATAFDPGGDPLLGALRSDALIQLGQFNPAQLQQTRPLQSIINEVGLGGAGDLRRQDLTFLNVAVSKIQQAIDGVITNGGSVTDANQAAQDAFAALPPQFQGPFVQAATAAGTGLSELAVAEHAFQTNLREFGPQAQKTSAEAAQGRLRAIEDIARLQSDFPTATASDFAQLEQAEQARQALQFDRAREQLLETADLGGFNPGAGIAELNRDQAAGDLDAILRALQIQGGRQELASQNIGALQNSLDPSAQQGTAALGLNASTSAAQIAANQALALSQIQASQPPKPNVAGDILGGLGNSLGLLGTLGLLSGGNAAGGPGSNTTRTIRTNTSSNTGAG